jgi:hypothetical protein
MISVVKKLMLTGLSAAALSLQAQDVMLKVE